MLNIFISYSHENTHFVKKLARKLLEYGHYSWVDKEELGVGERVVERIGDAIHKVDFVIAVISKASNESSWVKTELNQAMNREVEKESVIVMPVLIEDVELPPLLRGKSYVDFRSPGEFDQAFHRLIGSLREPKAWYEPPKTAVLVVGSALVEDIIAAGSEVEIEHRYMHLNRKYIVGERKSYLGGSGVNFSIRLCKTGHLVVPILSLGSDVSGKRTRSVLLEIMKKIPASKPILEFVNSDSFLCPGLRTSETVVISVEKSSRTTFTPMLQGIDRLGEFFESRLEAVHNIPQVEISSVMIGHVYSDSPELQDGAFTRGVVEKFHGLSFLFANFGSTQIKRGVKYWAPVLQKLSLMQLSLQEVFDFFRPDFPRYSLREIVKWFIDNGVSAIVTHDHFGVVATFNGRKGFAIGKVVLADPIPIDNVKDTTGAGDAFASGMVSMLGGKLEHSSDDFIDAINEARLWAAYACTTFGSSIHSPTREELDQFKKHAVSDDVQIFDPNESQAVQFFRVIERTLRS